MLAGAEYFAAGQPLKLKATSPQAALDEALEYLVQNTFTKMSYLKQLIPEPAQGNPGGPAQQRHRPADSSPSRPDENNPQAIDDVRNYVELCMTTPASQIVLHDMIEKRYARAALRLAG